MNIKVRVFIGDESALVREWLKRICERIGDAEVVGHVGTPNEFLEAISAARPDVAILDFKTCGRGLEVLKQIKKTFDPPIVIVFANRPSVNYRKRYVEAGADYFFDRSNEQRELAEVLKKLIEDYRKKRGVNPE